MSRHVRGENGRTVWGLEIQEARADDPEGLVLDGPGMVPAYNVDDAWTQGGCRLCRLGRPQPERCSVCGLFTGGRRCRRIFYDDYYGTWEHD